MHQGDRPSPSKLLLLDMHCETKCQQRIHGGYESIAVNICNLLIFNGQNVHCHAQDRQRIRDVDDLFFADLLHIPSLLSSNAGSVHGKRSAERSDAQACISASRCWAAISLSR